MTRQQFEDLQIEIQEQKEKLQELEAKLLEYDDGFLYKVEIWEFRNCRKYFFTNFECALERTLPYNGDNGKAKIFTNNPKYKDIEDDYETEPIYEPDITKLTQ